MIAAWMLYSLAVGVLAGLAALCLPVLAGPALPHPALPSAGSGFGA